MKRRQLVNQISDNVLSSFFPNMELRLKNLIADSMLAEAEKAGMLPPLNEENYHFMDNAARNHVNQARWYFSWESEDETT